MKIKNYLDQKRQLHKYSSVKGIEEGEINHFIHNLIFFYRVLTKLQNAFKRFL